MGMGMGVDDDADHVRRDADAAPGRGRPREHDAEHPPAGRRLDRHRGAERHARGRADRPPAARGRRGERAGGSIPDAIRERIAPLMAEAYGYTFWWAAGLLVLAFAGAVLLPWNKPAAPADEPAGVEDETEAPVLVHV